MIKAILLDYDGVVTAGVKDNVPAIRLAKNLNVSIEKATEWIVNIWDGFSTGKLNEQDAWRIIEKQYGQPVDSQQRDIWYTWEELKPLQEMLVLVRELKTKGYRVGLLSNVLPVTAQLIRENGGYDEFDFTVLSYEVGARKPSPLMYETALANLKGTKPEEVLYLDDRQPLTVAARELGIKSLHVMNHAEAIKKVIQLIAEQ